ncbi:MAG TPA: CDP-alcohol phosphatidyltransferase family protein [Thermoanaerobaculia bacterium]|nr:CDP-alcohol phosphatidyltransferase family protein [Thermoanaerobaculia bacterium]
MHVWRDRLFRWFAPLARRCPLSPNAVTLLALALNVIAAALLYQRQFLLAIVFLFIGGWADAFDGIVARVQEKTSTYGDFLDHFADRVSDILLITGWLLGNNVREEITLAVIIMVLLNGYIGTQIEASWHERNYDTVGRGEFVLALVVYPLVSFILIDNGWEGAGYAGLAVAEWMSLLLLAFAIFGIVQRFALAGRLHRGS